ncbi:MAG: hypothetical protein JXR07_04705 [Reichenbachiella sp.]
MKILRSLFALLFLATMFTSCADEEDYIRPDFEEATMDGGDRPGPGTTPPPLGG